MRVPSARLFSRYIQFIILFLFGVLAGMSAFLLLLGNELDTLHLKTRKLENQNVLYAERITELEEAERNMIQKQKNVVKDIVVHLSAPNEFVKADLDKRLMADLFFLKGKPLDYVAGFHEGIIRMITERTYAIEAKGYKIQVTTLVVTPTVHIYLTAHEEKG
ncbi:hypothetical protein [Aneurinibacillus soli]|uniref:hypothetical protein n=1 Tax=Aneurinibacillus soli TaxID=1500254 RepID=UPI000BBABB95|nr:hypothetical protein [Aneurinibacillus soli]